jgi:phytoene dehydrogenase-like protein
LTDSTLDAVVVGSGPNGLAAAVYLAMAGRSVTVLEAADEIGGGTRTAELTLPGVLHDVCSAAHPYGVGSPYFSTLPLEEHGLTWKWPEVDAAHPLDGGRAGVLRRSIDDTAAGLGVDGDAWRSSFGWMAEKYDVIAAEFFGPIVHVPRRPVTLSRFGLRALLPATRFVHRFSTDEARALFAGASAHAYVPLTWPTTSGVGSMFISAAHAVGWPVAAGGSRAITDALASLLRANGGTIETGRRITRLDELPPARTTLFDVGPETIASIAGDRLPAGVRKAFTRWRPGAGAFKIDLAVEGGIPWLNDECRRAGTVHLGGTVEQVAASEAQVHRGQMPERPFILLSQQYLADPQRSVGDIHPIWAYAHVPAGYAGDATEAILDSIERYAPGTRERIVGQHVMSTSDLAAYNANYVGGNVTGGANDPRQLVFRPRVTGNPYSLGVPGMYICSASSPPGGGVHGMCGYQAARRAEHYLSH